MRLLTQDRIAAIADPAMPGEQRQRALEEALNDPSLGTSWSPWRKLIVDGVNCPEVAAPLIRHFAQNLPADDALFWQDLIACASQTKLPSEVGWEIFCALWRDADRIETCCNPERSVIAILLDMALDSAIADAAVRTGMPAAFRGTMTYEQFERFMYVSLDYPFARPGSYGQVLNMLARQVVDNPGVPLEMRVTLLQRLPHWEILTFVRDSQVPHSYYPEIAQYLFAQVHDFILRYELRRDLANDSPVWHEIRNTTAFYSKEPSDLITILTETTHSDRVRRLANAWIYTALRHGSSEDAERVFRRMFQQFLDPHASKDVTDKLFQTIWVSSDLMRRHITLLRKTIGEVLADTRLSVSERGLLLRRLRLPYFRHHFNTLWDAIDQSGNTFLRAEFLEVLIEKRLLGECARTLKFQDSRRETAAKDESRDGEQAWRMLRQVGQLVQLDTVSLAKLALDVATPAIFRQSIPVWIEEADWIESDIKRLWRFVVCPEGSRIWDLPDLRKAVTGKLAMLQLTRDFPQIIQRGPQHPCWTGVVRLIQYPDQQLAWTVLALLALPTDDAWEGWRRRGPDVPEEVLLVVSCALANSEAVDPLIDLLQSAFRDARSRHALVADLTDAVLRVSLRSEVIQSRIWRVLRAGRLPTRRERGSLAVTVIDVVQLLAIEASLLANERAKPGIYQIRDSDGLAEGEDLPFVPIAPGVPFDGVRDQLRSEVARRLQRHFSSSSADEIEAVLARSTAPATLAAHYLQVHPDGLPLLAEAMRAVARGSNAWRTWRFWRDTAIQQLEQLTDAQLVSWSEDTSTTLWLENVSEDVLHAAERIRTRVRRALENTEIPEAYAELIHPARASIDRPERWVQRYTVLQSVIGRRIHGAEVANAGEVLAELPESMRQDLARAFRKSSEGDESPLSAERRRDLLLTCRHRLARAIDLIRLLHCDAQALARNELRARDEPGRGQPKVRSHLNTMAYSFRNPCPRSQRQNAIHASGSLNALIADLSEALQEVKTFVSSRPLTVAESSDFATLIEIGHRPYGQASCQNYLNGHSINRALLAYVVDAMTKAITVRTVPARSSEEGTLVARAIVRLGATSDTKTPVLVVEKTYAAGGQGNSYTPIIHEAARRFAGQRGWRAAIPETDATLAADVVRIPGSQNRVQYEDGSFAMVNAHEHLPEGPYQLKIRYLDERR